MNLRFNFIIEIMLDMFQFHGHEFKSRKLFTTLNAIEAMNCSDTIGTMKRIIIRASRLYCHLMITRDQVHARCRCWNDQ